MGNVTIRKAVPKDVPQMLQMIKELATYEKAPNEVVVTEQELLEDGFGDNPVYFCYIAEKEDNVVGMALCYYKYSTWKGRCIYLEDIIVKEAERGNGIGKKLLQTVIRKAQKEKVRRLEWQVLDWNEPAINFYKKFQTRFDDEWINCKLTYDQLQNFKFE
ncbi:MAG: GNAT family N-acetyltransferase [Bacteroidetes bacterium]|nr:MAG: GNAT family N-acetyltransferase [Bacteroidota bacterium]